nr:tyrosine-type recombinase/integrase [Vaginisenegalia massiliensis]
MCCSRSKYGCSIVEIIGFVEIIGSYDHKTNTLGCLPLINIHGFRHTHFSLLFKAGLPMKDVMQRRGHFDIQTTMNIYTHVTKDNQNKSAEFFAKHVNF